MSIFPLDSCQQAHKIFIARPKVSKSTSSSHRTLSSLSLSDSLSFSLSLGLHAKFLSSPCHIYKFNLPESISHMSSRNLLLHYLSVFQRKILAISPSLSLSLALMLFLSLLPQVLRVSDNLNEQIEKCCKFLLARYEKSFIICAGAENLTRKKCL